MAHGSGYWSRPKKRTEQAALIYQAIVFENQQVELPPEYVRFLMCQNLYGGIDPDKLDALPNERVSEDWFFYVTTAKYQAQKNAKKKGKTTATNKTDLNSFMGTSSKGDE